MNKMLKSLKTKVGKEIYSKFFNKEGELNIKSNDKDILSYENIYAWDKYASTVGKEVNATWEKNRTVADKEKVEKNGISSHEVRLMAIAAENLMALQKARLSLTQGHQHGSYIESEEQDKDYRTYSFFRPPFKNKKSAAKNELKDFMRVNKNQMKEIIHNYNTLNKLNKDKNSKTKLAKAKLKMKSTMEKYKKTGMTKYVTDFIRDLFF